MVELAARISKGEAKERGGDDQALEERGVKDFHDARKEAWHIGGAIAYKTLGQYAGECLALKARRSTCQPRTEFRAILGPPRRLSALKARYSADVHLWKLMSNPIGISSTFM